MAFSLLKLTALSTNQVRVTFTEPPLLVGPNGVNDGLNLLNYAISGPSTTLLTAVQLVDSDPASVDLTLGTVLEVGTVWNITVSNIQTSALAALSPPTTLQFTAIQVTSPTINNGATNSSEFEALQTFLGTGIEGPNIDAVLAAIASGDTLVQTNIANAFHELFLSTADGIYLAYLAASQGISKPPQVGMSDELFSKFAITIRSNKLTDDAILEVLEIFYGAAAVKANSISGLQEPFNLVGGEVLNLTIDRNLATTVTFVNADFVNPGNATADEVAFALTRYFEIQNVNAYAVKLLNELTGTNGVQIFSRTLGLGSAVQITGGNAQNALQFPTLIESADTAGTWNVTIPSYGVVRYTTVGVTTVDLSQVTIGDYVNVTGSHFDADNRGSFPIINVGVSYPGGTLTQFFDIASITATPQTAVAIGSKNDILWFSPTVQTTFLNASQSVILGPNGDGGTTVTIPATSQAVHREEFEAAYLQPPTVLKPTNIVRDGTGLVTVTVDNTLSAGQQIIVDNFYSNSRAPTNAPVSGITASSLNSQWNDAGSGGGFDNYLPAGIIMSNGSALVTGGWSLSTISYDETFVFTNTGQTIRPDGSVAINYTGLVGPNMNNRRTYGRLVNLTLGPDAGNALIIGGLDYTISALDSVDMYDPTSNTITAMAPMNNPRWAYDAMTLPDGRVLVAGGTNDLNAFDALATCEVFDPNALTWSYTGSMNSARTWHRMVLLNNGLVLVVGGAGGNFSFPPAANYTCELFDPTSNTWSYTGPMSYGRLCHGLYVLPNGKVLAIGGGGSALNGSGTLSAFSMELYDPDNGRWSVVNSNLLAPIAQATDSDSLGYTDILPIRNGAQIVVNRIDSPSQGRCLVIDTNTLECKFITNFQGGGTFSSWEALIGPFADGTIGAFGAFSDGGAVSIYVPAADFNSGAGINGTHTLLTATATTLTFQTPDYPFYALDTGNATITPMEAAPGQFAGPFVYDTSLGGVAVTKTVTTNTDNLFQGQQYGSVNVASTVGFPNKTGYICINFGYADQQSPIRYLGVLDSTTLIIDNSYRFTQNAPIGSTITLLVNNGTWVPPNPTEVGSFYLTDSPAGRAAAEAAVESIIAAGLNIEVEVAYPGDRGLGAEGYPTHGSQKLSDIVEVFAENIDEEVAAARED